jgi:hypothetical protein
MKMKEKNQQRSSTFFAGLKHSKLSVLFANGHFVFGIVSPNAKAPVLRSNEIRVKTIDPDIVDGVILARVMNILCPS